MDKVSIEEISQELGIDSESVLQKTKELKLNAQNKNSKIDIVDAERLANYILTGEKGEESKITLKTLKNEIDNIKKSDKTFKTTFRKQIHNLNKINQLSERINRKLEDFDTEKEQLIKKIENDANNLIEIYQKKYENILIKINKCEEDVKDILSKVTSHKSSELYEEKAKELQKEARSYQNRFLFSIIIGLIISISIFYFFKQDTDFNLMFFLKLIAIIPIFIISTYYWNLYNKIRKLQEEYEFKTILAKTLISNYEFVLERTKDKIDDKKLHDKTLFESLQKILENPSNALNKKTSDNNIYSEINKIVDIVNKIKKME